MVELVNGKIMYIAVNKKDRNEVHSFTWGAHEELFINNQLVDKDDWDIIEVEPVNKQWEYSLTTNTIWASFDHGTVTAKTIEEARELAIQQIKYDLQKVNDALASSDNTQGFFVDMDLDKNQLEIKEVSGL